MDKLDFYKHHIENSLIDIMNTGIRIIILNVNTCNCIPNRDLQYAISQLSTLSLKLLQQVVALAPVTEDQLVEAMDLSFGVIAKNMNKLSRLSFVTKSAPEQRKAIYQPTKIGNKVVEVQNQLTELLDKQHAELVDRYTPEQLSLIAAFLQDLQHAH